MPEQLPRISIPDGQFPPMVTRSAACVLNYDRGYRAPEDLERAISCLRDYLNTCAEDDEGIEGFWWGVRAVTEVSTAEQ